MPMPLIMTPAEIQAHLLAWARQYGRDEREVLLLFTTLWDCFCNLAAYDRSFYLTEGWRRLHDDFIKHGTGAEPDRSEPAYDRTLTPASAEAVAALRAARRVPDAERYPLRYEIKQNEHLGGVIISQSALVYEGDKLVYDSGPLSISKRRAERIARDKIAEIYKSREG